VTVVHPVFRRARWIVCIACGLALGAMIRYPGGTPLDPTTQRYSLSRNFLSDLGMTVAYNHQSNRLGASMFVLSLLLLVVGLGHAVIGIARRLQAHPAARRWARAAAVFGFLVCVAFAGVAVTPENRVMTAHIAFTMWAWRITPIIAVLLALASFHSPGLRRRVGMVWLVVATLLGAYVALLTWGPRPTAVEGLVNQVVAQKLATIVVLGSLLFVAREMDRSATAAVSPRAVHPLD
jgi:hypothetical membrane protein